MRELRFRAWDKKRKEWVHDTDHAVNLLGETILLGEFLRRPDGEHRVTLEELGDIEVMQSTGLLDRNGKEVFEGDVVKFCHWNDCDTNKERKWKIGKIVWDAIGYCFTLEPREPMNSLYSSKMYEIIGDIHEHSHLLTR